MEKDEVQKVLDQDVIEPCQSSWISPHILVTKKDGSTRFCKAYCKVNDITCKDIDDPLDAGMGSQYFSTLGLYFLDSGRLRLTQRHR